MARPPAAQDSLKVPSNALILSLLVCPVNLSQIIPADLNAWLYQMESNIAWMGDLISDTTIAERFSKAAAVRKQAIQHLLWDEAAGRASLCDNVCLR